MPRRPPVARERLAALCHLTSAGIAAALGCCSNHVTILLRQHGLSCAPAGTGRRALPPVPASAPAPALPGAGRRAVSIQAAEHIGPAQRQLIAAYQAGNYSPGSLAQQLGVSHTMLRRELTGVRQMPPERLVALAKLLT